ncbi:MAG: fibronectin type III domain-containing protein, partial [Bacteroidota bacterium]
MIKGKGHIVQLILLLLFMVKGVVSFSQVYPVQATLNIAPPYSIYLTDYTATGSTRLNFQAYLADLSRPSLDVRFRLLIEGNGIEIRTKESYIGSRYTLLSGSPTQIFGDELQEYFNPENLDMAGLSRSQFERTGALPEGIYRFTMEVLEYNRGVQISNSAFSTAWLILNDPPIINSPIDNEVVTASDPQTVRFQWTPRHKGSPNSSFSTEYELKIVEIWPENRNPNDAINTSNPIFETITSNNYFIYGLAEPPLIPGRRYAFQLKAKALAGIDQLDLFKNHGYSEVKAFTFGEICNPPTEINASKAANAYLNLEWQPSPTNSAFNILFRENSEGAEWFEKFSYMPTLRLDKLKPGIEYEVVLQSACGTLLSEESEPVILSTTNNENEFTCGDLDLNIDLENKVPINTLSKGDRIVAGDFKIELDSISNSNGHYKGTGIASFPILNFVKAKVRFDDIQVNTDRQVFSGNVTTVYNPNSAMMYDLDKDETDEGGISDVAETDSITSVEGDSLLVEQIPGEPIAVDSMYTNSEGNLIVVTDGVETIVEPPAEGETQQYIDSSGNIITVDSNGKVQESSAGTASEEGGSTSPVDNGLKFEFGPIIVTANEDKEPEQSGEECVYNEVSASVDIKMEEVDLDISKEFKIESAVFSYTKNCTTGELLSANLKWNDEAGKDIGDVAGIGARVFNLDLEIDADGNITGGIHMQAYLNQDKALTNLAILRAGLTGEFKYTFKKSSDGYSGSFDFNGIEGINLDLIKQDQVLASIENGQFDEDGLLTGRMRLIQEVEFGASGLTMNIKKLDFDIHYDLGGEFMIEQGSATIVISSIEGINGVLTTNVEILNNETTATIDSESLEAFGMQFSDLNLSIDLDADLNLTALEGTLKAKHEEFGVDLSVNSFKVINGQLEKFSFNGEVDYEGVHVIIQEANLDKGINALVLNAYVEIDKEGIFVAANVKDFTIDKDGNITWGSYDAEFDGIKTFGPLTIAISGVSGEESGKWRATQAKASLSIQPEGLKGDPIMITDATINYEKHRSKEQYKNLEIIINQVNISSPPLGPLNIKLTDLAIKLQTDEDYMTGTEGDASKIRISDDSYLHFNVGLNDNVQIGKLLFIDSGVSGEITYSFNGDGLKGDFSYQNVENLNLYIRKGETDLASLTDASIADDGVLSGTLSALQGAEFSTGGFTANVEEMTFDVVVPIQGDFSEARITSGNGKFNLSNLGKIEGDLSVTFQMDTESNISAKVLSTSEITAFGMSLNEFDLKLELTPEFELTKIEGHLEAQHPEFNAALKVSDFLLENGELVSFNFEGNVTYKGFNLKLNKANYENSVLVIDGKVAINVSGSAAWLAVKELNIAADGKVTIKGIEGELDKSPVYVAFKASMDKTKFSGSFTGKLSGIGLEGKIDIGVEEDQYNYAYLKLASSANIPLGPSGLKLTKLGG